MNGVRARRPSLLPYLRRIYELARDPGGYDFRSPIVPGMSRGVATKRDRVLTDDELRPSGMRARRGNPLQSAASIHLG